MVTKAQRDLLTEEVEDGENNLFELLLKKSSYHVAAFLETDICLCDFFLRSSSTAFRFYLRRHSSCGPSIQTGTYCTVFKS